ncbi:STM4015 family protein [Paenibacillus oleatilyticus]|uniref:STM4015 family protein n=1 Tax=Paenibacillus oleatilyticus TaxID=2594886 RepID=UPI001C1F9668|nr:STM4015 family protein [Paenibacillus oleatilyticus]MBU7317503.1 STM4015 family protein [Paenibacillus oleatilyticus]
MTEVRLEIGYDEYEDGMRMEQLIEQLAAKPESREVVELTIGSWGQAYEDGPDSFMDVLIGHKDAFPALRKLFIGDMDSEECEISWIMQTNLAPLLEAFPQLTSFCIQGSTGLSLKPLKHERLEELVIICGGLSREVLAEIRDAELPELRKLELYLGVDDYGFDGSLEDVKPLMEPGRFPKLTYLGLKDSEIQDEIAIEIANSPILDQLHTLDLSLGTLSDKGAEALLASERVRKLSFLDLNYHYMSDEMVKRWQTSGMSVDVSDQQQSDDEDDWRYPAVTE